MGIECIFCGFESYGVDGLKAHSATCNLHPLAAERDQLRAEVERLRKYNESLLRERDDRIALLAQLRGALETLNHAAKVAISTEYGGCFDEETPLVIRLLDGTCDETDTALTITPASAGNRTDEETEAAHGR